jgi:hypothetical protein
VKHILYVVEIPVSSNPAKYKLLACDDESGSNRPLVWAVREDAEAYADGLSGLIAGQVGAGFELEYIVVPLTGSTDRENEPGLPPLPVREPLS